MGEGVERDSLLLHSFIVEAQLFWIQFNVIMSSASCSYSSKGTHISRFLLGVGENSELAENLRY
jgi:hypothetical protein